MAPPSRPTACCCMMLLGLLASCLSSALATAATPSSSAASQRSIDPRTSPPPVGCGWNLAWSDEFEAPLLDGSKWTPSVDCWGGGNGEAQCYTSRNQNVWVDQEQGHLVLTARRERYSTDGTGCTSNLGCAGTRDYTSGKVTTVDKASWRYGLISVRARIPKGQGLWPAVWMMPQTSSDFDGDGKYGPWAASGEIDILETTGHSTDTVQGTIFYGDSWPRQAFRTSSKIKLACVEDFSEDFHVYSLEWGERSLTWLVDGTVYFTQSLDRVFTEPGQIPHYTAKGQPFDQPFYLLLNVAIGGAYGGPVNPDDAWSSPELRIDWVRVYQRPDNASPTPFDNGLTLKRCFGLTQSTAGAAVAPSCRAKPNLSLATMCGVISWTCTYGGVSCGSRADCGSPSLAANLDWAVNTYYLVHKEAQGDGACVFGGAAETYYPRVECGTQGTPPRPESPPSPSGGVRYINVNCGGSYLRDFTLTPWSGDRYYEGGHPGQTWRPMTNFWRRGGREYLFQTERYGRQFNYRFPIPRGQYDVHLYFAEFYWSRVGQRVFDVAIEGDVVLSRLDIVKAAGGPFRPYIVKFTPWVEDGTLNVDFKGIRDNAKVSAIRIIRVN